MYSYKIMNNVNNVNILQQDIRQLQHDVKQLTKVVQQLTQVCSRMDKSSEKMSDHINFVEGTYETLRSPLDFITKRVNALRGIEPHELPRLKDSRIV